MRLGGDGNLDKNGRIDRERGGIVDMSRCATQNTESCVL